MATISSEDEGQSPEDRKGMTVTIGIMTIPLVIANFTDKEGNNPFQEAVMSMCREVLGQQVQKLVQTVAVMCQKNGFALEIMDSKKMVETAKSILEQDDGSQDSLEIRGVVKDDGPAVFDQDFITATREGRSTKN